MWNLPDLRETEDHCLQKSLQKSVSIALGQTAINLSKTATGQNDHKDGRKNL